MKMLGQANIPIRALLDKLSTDLDKAKEKIKNSVEKVSEIGAKIGKAAFAAAVAGVAALATAIAGVGISAIGVAQDVKTANQTMITEFGATEKEAVQLTNIAKDVWASGFGETVTEAAQRVAKVRQQLGDLSNNELQNVATKSYQFFDTFGVEGEETISAVNTLMQNFGLTSTEALDFLASGFQQGLNNSDDFIDTIQEYSVQFSNAGADAGQFFSLMQSGLQGGMLGTDKAADAFKEFGVRILDGSKTTEDALKGLGINADEFTNKIASGEITIAEAFQTIVGELGNVEDKSLLMQAGVGLIGTQFEDLGIDASLALDLTATKMDDLTGSADTLETRYDNLGHVWTVFKREGQLALEPLGNILLDLANNIVPKLIEKWQEFTDKVKPIVEGITEAVKTFVEKIQEGHDPVDAFIKSFSDFLPPELAEKIRELANETIPTLIEKVTELKDRFLEFVTPIAEWIATFFSLNDVLTALAVVVGVVLLNAVVAFLASIAPVTIIMLALIGVIALLRNIWENDFLSIKSTLQEFWETTALPIFESVKTWIGETLPGIINTLSEIWGTIWPLISAVLQLAWANIQASLNAIWGIIQGVIIPIVQELWAIWVNVVWPAIQQKLQEAWAIIKPILESLTAFILEQLIPKVKELSETFQKRFEEIKQFVKNMWIVVSTIFKEVKRWIEDNLVPIIKFLAEKFKEHFEKIEGHFNKLWEKVEPHFNTFKKYIAENLPEWLETLQEAWDRIWGGLKETIQPVIDAVNTIKDAVKEFWNFLSSETFSFNFELPDLPDWALPGSPLPLHTAWKNFGQYMDTLTISPHANLDNMEPLAGILDNEVDSSQRSLSYSSETTIYTQQDPLRLLRASRWLDQLGNSAI